MHGMLETSAFDSDSVKQSMGDSGDTKHNWGYESQGIGQETTLPSFHSMCSTVGLRPTR